MKHRTHTIVSVPCPGPFVADADSHVILGRFRATPFGFHQNLWGRKVHQPRKNSLTQTQRLR